MHELGKLAAFAAGTVCTESQEERVHFARVKVSSLGANGIEMEGSEG